MPHTTHIAANQIRDPAAFTDHKFEKYISLTQQAYHLSIVAIREAAQDCGYAIGEHGSCERDIDLIAVPWTDSARSAEFVIGAINAAIEQTCKSGITYIDPVSPITKPHGRLAWIIHVGGGPYFDISVLPQQ